MGVRSPLQPLPPVTSSFIIIHLPCGSDTPFREGCQDSSTRTLGWVGEGGQPPTKPTSRRSPLDDGRQPQAETTQAVCRCFGLTKLMKAKGKETYHKADKQTLLLNPRLVFLNQPSCNAVSICRAPASVTMVSKWLQMILYYKIKPNP